MSTHETFRGYAMMKPDRLIVGVSGASGIIYGIRALEALRQLGIESHMVASKAAEMTLRYETGLSIPEFRAGADHVYKMPAVGASIGAPGTPGVGIVIIAMLLTTIGVPPTGVALIMGVDRILDMSRTAINVAGDLVAAIVMDSWVGGKENAAATAERERRHVEIRRSTGEDVIVEGA